MTLALVFIFAILAGFDAYVTERVVVQEGLAVEMNPAIHSLAEWLSVRWAIRLGIAIPTVILAIVTIRWDLCAFAGFLCGVRTMLAFRQLLRLRGLHV